MSSWIDKSDYCLKMYDVMSLNRNLEGQCKKITNETYSIASNTKQIRVLFNPKMRLKRMSCVTNSTKETNPIMAREYTRDYRDTTAWKKIPKDY